MEIFIITVGVIIIAVQPGIDLWIKTKNWLERKKIHKIWETEQEK